MLVRTQVLLEEKQKLELEKLALLAGVSMSRIIREVIPKGIRAEKEKITKRAKKKMGGAEFLLQQAKKAVAGPGDSEYDKYAYDF